MAVFKQEMNWSTYQNEQLKVLRDIEKAFSSSLELSKNSEKSMSSMEKTLNFMAKASEATAKNMSLMTREWTKDAVEFNEIFKQLDDSAKRVDTSFRGAAKGVDEFSGAASDSAKKLKSAMSSIGSGIATFLINLKDQLGGFRGIGEQANAFSETSNRAIFVSGRGHSDVKASRNEIMSIVAELNMQTGSLYSPQESYRTIVSTMQGVTSSLDAMEEMTRPLLLASETLDVNINSVADLFNKFYTRYSFSSSHMEEALDGIRGNTAGNSANAEATLKNISELESWIGYIAGNDNDKRLDMLDSISHYTSWLESMNVESGPFTKYLKDIAYGDYANNTELINILSKAGITATEATNMAREGQFEELTVSIMEGISSMFDTVDGSYSLGQALDNLGLDRELAMDIKNLIGSDNYKSLEDFLEDMKNSPSMTSLAEDKYVSAADKTNHWLEQIYAQISSIQEFLGVGITDIATVYALMKGTGVGRGLGSKFSEYFLGSDTSRGLLRTLGTNSAAQGMLTTGVMTNGASNGPVFLNKLAGLGGGLGGAAMLAGGAAAGLGLGAYGIAKGVQDIQSGDTGYGITNLAGAAAGLGGAGALIGLGVTNPVGWVALAISGVTLAGVEIAKAVTATSGVADQLSASLEKAGESIVAEQATRVEQLTTLEDSISTAKDLNEANELARKSGLLSLVDGATYTKEKLLELAGAAKDAAYELGDEAAFNLDAAKTAIEEAAKQETTSVMDGLYDKVSSMMTDGVLSKDNDPTKYAEVKTAFTKMAESITDDEQREKALTMVDTIFKNDKLSTSELKAFTDKGGNLRALFSGGIDRKNAVGRQSVDIEAFNSILAGFGVDTSYSIQAATDALINMSDSYVGWKNALDSTSKEKYIEAFNSSWKNLSEDHKDILRPHLISYAEDMGVTPFAQGTNYVTHDQLAVIHEGEAVVPKKYNPAVNNSEVRRLTSQLKESNDTLIEELREIKEFLSVWREGNQRDSKINSMQSRTAFASAAVRNYLNLQY